MAVLHEFIMLENKGNTSFDITEEDIDVLMRSGKSRYHIVQRINVDDDIIQGLSYLFPGIPSENPFIKNDANKGLNYYGVTVFRVLALRLIRKNLSLFLFENNDFSNDENTINVNNLLTLIDESIALEENGCIVHLGI